MRHVVLGACALAVLFVWALPSAAEPTILGPTGLIVNPTADLTQVEHGWIALNFFDNSDNSVWTANVTGSVADNFELGLGAVHPDDGDDGITFFLKWLFLPEEENFPGGAVGVTATDIAGDSSQTWYLVASKFFYFGDKVTESASMHGGVSYITGADDEGIEFFGGMDFEFMDDFFAIAEYTSDENSIFEGFTYGVRYYFDLHLTGQAALIDGDLHIGASYIF